MGVKPGYKQTEAGVIPEEWDVLPMGSLGSFSKGQGIRKNEASSGKIPCVRYGEIYTHHNDFIRSFNSRISAEVAGTSRRIKKGDLLFAGSGETKEEIGKCVAFVGDEEAYAGGDIVILTPNKGNSKFFGYLFNAPIVVRQKASKGQGDAIVHISSSALSSIAIPLPRTEAEQEAIATALSDVDALIGALDQLIVKKRDIKQAAMQQLLTGQTRLPGFSGEWEVIRVGDIFHVTRGQVLAMTKTTEECIGEYIYPVYSSQTKAYGLAGYYKDYLFENCITWTTDGANAGDVKLRPEKFYCTNVCGVLESENGYSNLCVAAILNSVSKKYVSYIGNPKLMNNVVADIRIKIPSRIEEQTAIATVLSDIDAEIAALEARRDKTRALKQGMMQELLTGKTRLI
jgi:type I restriction enzyme S subunit